MISRNALISSQYFQAKRVVLVIMSSDSQNATCLIQYFPKMVTQGTCSKIILTTKIPVLIKKVKEIKFVRIRSRRCSDQTNVIQIWEPRSIKSAIECNRSRHNLSLATNHWAIQWLKRCTPQRIYMSAAIPVL